MIKPEHVPPEVVAALVNTLYDNRVDVAWSDASEAIAAALNAWPGAEVHNFDGWTHAEGLVLPLSTEASEE